MISLILLSTVLFATTHIDDLLLLVSFFADRTIPRTAIVGGQYIGVILLLIGGLVGSGIAVIVPPLYLRLFGVVPLVIGLSKLLKLFRSRDGNAEEVHPAKTHVRHMWGVATLTVASGGDNLGVYLPFFATHSLQARLVIVLVFLAMTAVWCVAACRLAHHRLLEPIIRRWGSRLLPLVLIALGIWLLFAG
jgi:cadmium resistance protein CadD (predicted permease)